MHKDSFANKLAEEVVRAVQKLDTGKSAGLDGIYIICPTLVIL